MGRSINARAGAGGEVVPIGGIAAVSRSGLKYKAVGEVVRRSDYPDLSEALPRYGALAVEMGEMSFPARWVNMAYGNGVLVAINSGYGGSGWTDSDHCACSYDNGKTWQYGSLPTVAYWRSIAFGNGVFVAIASSTDTSSGYTGTRMVAVSSDGMNWTLYSTALPTAIAWQDVIFGAGLFVAVATGSSTAGTTVAATSPDGINWTSRTLPVSAGWSRVAYLNGMFISVPGALGVGTSYMTSTDGINWTARTFPATANWREVSFGNGLFVAIGLNGSTTRLVTSPDGVNWTVRAGIDGLGEVGALAFGNGVFIKMGRTSGTTSGSAIFTSFDGINWRVRYSVATIAQTCFYTGGAFVAPVWEGGGTTRKTVYRIFAENLTNSDDLYLAGETDKFVRVK